MARPSLLASAALGGVALATILFGGCSIAFDLDREQCETNDDCAALGFAGATCGADKVCVTASDGGGGQGGEGQGGSGGSPLPENFACLDGYTAPDPGATVHHDYRFEIATADPGTPPVNAMMKVCRSLDASCSDPELTMGLDAAGVAEFDLASDFQGFIELTADNTMPTLVFFQQPVIIPPGQKVIRVIDETSFTNLSNLAGVTVDPTRGTAILLAHDCADERSPGVRFTSSEIDEDTTPYHFKGSLPDPDATETDEQGAGGFANIVPGNITVQATIADGGRFIGESTFSVRAGHLSYVPMGPTQP